MGHGKGHDSRLGEERAASWTSRGPANMLEAKVSWVDTDKPGHEQNSVQQGFYLSLFLPIF